METKAQTRDRILDAAERLFADGGFAATSLRQITSAAEVNLAAVNYHFGSKEGLIHEVFARIVGPINEERLSRLDALERGDATPEVEDVVEAFVGPAIRRMSDPAHGSVATRLLGRTYAEPAEYLLAVFQRQFGEVASRFVRALSLALPQLDAAEVHWRMHFMVGAMAHTMADARRLKLFSKGICDPTDATAIVGRLVPFLGAGMRAGSPGAGPPAAAGVKEKRDR